MKKLFYRLISKKEWKQSEEFNNRQDKISGLTEVIDCPKFIKMDTLQKVIEIVNKQYTEGYPSDIKETDNLEDDLGLDSLDVVEIIINVEKEFDVKIDEEDSDRIRTVKDIVDAVNKQKK